MGTELLQSLLLSSPTLVVFVTSIVLLTVDAFGFSRLSRSFIAALGLVLSFAALSYVAAETTPGRTVFRGMFYADPISVFLSALILAGSLVSILIVDTKLEAERIDSRAEFFALLLMSAAGAMLFASSADLVSLFISLEIMSLALYCLCGAGIGVKKSSEAALKYFLLGSFASAFMLYGVALIYGLTGTTSLELVSEALMKIDSPLALAAIALLLIGALFKVGAVPFHFWVPDVYQGAPTGVAGFMACVIKAAAVGVALRILWVGLEHQVLFWSAALTTVSVLTMSVANLAALGQTSVKRMLAYSSIAHAGYLLIGFVASEPEFGGGAAILFYLVAYTSMTLGAFGVVQALSSDTGPGVAEHDSGLFEGLGYRRPFLAVLMSLFLLSLAGIPPGMAGLLGKFYIFNSAIKASYVWLALVGVINSAVSCYYYLRVIVSMYFSTERPEPEQYRLAWPLACGLALCAAAVLVFGIFPSLIHDPAVIIMASFR